MTKDCPHCGLSELPRHDCPESRPNPDFVARLRNDHCDTIECEHGFFLSETPCPNPICLGRDLAAAADMIASRRVKTIDRLKEELAKPFPKEEWEKGTEDVFDPWNVFPCFYGSYSSEFDDMAILVLENIRDGKWGADHGEGLAHEMFREVLCTSDLCDYGTSPRGCFPNWGSGFAELMPTLIEKWRDYRRLEWGED